MKPISVRLPEQPYREPKSLAAGKGKPAASLLREAILEYLARERRSLRSILDPPAHDSGRLKRRWARADLIEEMRAR